VAIKVYNGTNWDDCLGTQTITTTGNNVTTSFTYGAAFTAPNTSNKITGVVFFLNSIPTSGDLMFEISESSVQVATVTANRADLQLGLNYARFTTPYQFTTTGASAYKIGVKNTAANSGSLARDAGGTSTMLFATYDTATTLGATDDAIVVGHHNAGMTTKTLTLSGTGNSWGSGTDRSITSTTSRSMGAALQVGNGGTVTFDTTASTTLTIKGAVMVYKGGTFTMSGHASDISKVSTLVFDNATADGDFGIITASSTYGGVVNAVGKTVSVKAQYASGTGTAADPIVTQAAHGFAVNDEIIVPGTSHSTNQIRYVISVPSATQLVVANTVGGAEAAISNTPAAGSYIANMTRNCVVKNVTTTRGFWIFHSSSETCAFDYSRLEYANCLSGKGVNPIGSSITGTMNGLVVYHNSAAGRTSITIAGTTTQTITDVVLLNTRGTNYSAQSGIAISGANKTMSGVYAYADPSSTTMCAALSISSTAVNNTISGLHSYGGNASNGSAGYAVGVYGSGNTFTDCTINSSRVQGVYLGTGSIGNEFQNCDMAQIGTNTIDVFVQSSGLITALFSSCKMGSATLISNYLNTLEGSEIKFHELDDSTSKHRWYTNHGSAWSSGSGLTDTTVRTASSLALAIKPEDNTSGQSWEFLVPAVPSSQCGVFGYGYRNATFSAGTFKVELFLPGSTVADASYTFATTTGSWLPFNISAYYSGSATRYATVRVTAITATAGAYAFIDDLYDAGTGNKIAGLDAWHEGKPSPIMVAADYSAVPALVWGYSDATTSADTMGQRQVDALAAADYTTPPTAAAIEAEVLDSVDGVEAGLTARKALRLITAALAGKISGADTSTVTIRNAVADDADRITATVDTNGNRTALTYDLD
jgi:hypothetical protein